MAERIVSAGVYLNEKEQKYLSQGTSPVGAAFVGPFLKGPAFVPTVVTSPTDAINKFGNTYEKYYTPYALQGYLKHAGVATVMRVLWDEGYTKTNTQILPINLGTFTSGSVALGDLSLATWSLSDGSDFYLTDPDGLTTYTFTAVEDADDYIDSDPQFYFTSGSDLTSSLNTLLSKITSSFSFTSVALTNAITSVTLSFSASDIGVGGNNIEFETSSFSVTLSGGVEDATTSKVAALIHPTENVTSIALDATSTAKNLLISIAYTNPPNTSTI